MPDNSERVRLTHQVITATTHFLHVIGIAAVLYQTPNYWRQPYHTSALSGEAWVNELIHGHPDRIYNDKRNSQNQRSTERVREMSR